ncbi:MAG: alpha/beta hydrolase [Gemmatimonadota bacterium]
MTHPASSTATPAIQSATGSVTTLLLPGLGNSGPEHWQSHWERGDRTCIRVMQAEWDAPRCEDWAQTLDAAVRASTGDVVFVSHSSSCALVAHWARIAAPELLHRVRGALLVAPSDPLGPHYPSGATGFAPVPRERLPFRSIVVASENDEYVTVAIAHEYASAWGSEFQNIGRAGHINAASGHGAWPDGLRLLDRLRGDAVR